MLGEIETERLRMRLWRPEDREPFARMNADPRVMEFFPALLSRAESDALADRIEAEWQARGFGVYAAELRDSGAFAGFIGFSVPLFEAHFTPAVEIGWRLPAEYHGRGLATEGARAALERGFRDLALEEVVSFTVPDHLASRRVMEKLGMTRDPADDFDNPRVPVGHPRRRHVLYRIRRSEFTIRS